MYDYFVRKSKCGNAFSHGDLNLSFLSTEIVIWCICCLTVSSADAI